MHPRRLAFLLSVGLTLAAVLAGVTALSDRPPAPAPRAVAARVAAVVPAIDVLHRWDLRRSRAWAEGDVRALRRLYTPGSRTGRRDAAALTAYADRGLRVTGVRMQLLAVELRSSAEDAMVLLVTDRMTRAVARGGGHPVVLPRDEPSTWRVSLRLLAGEWRVAEVRRGPTPAPP